MQVSILSLGKTPEKWNLVYEYYRLRRRVFIDQRGWELITINDIEFEQYDSAANVRYVIGHDQNHILGGARLIRCDTKTGPAHAHHSYMIRDAYRGIIDLPSTLCFEEPPETSDCWELTRLVVEPLTPAKAGVEILNAAFQFVASQQASSCLVLGSPAIMRLGRKYGYRPEPIGPIHSFKGERFLAFQVPITPSLVED